MDPLLPLLVARSGAALIELVRWALPRRPRDWVYRMLYFVAMDQDAQLEILRQVPFEPAPRLTEQRERVIRFMLEQEPSLGERLFREEREAAEKARAEAAEEARRALAEEDRRLLRRVLSRRNLPLSPAEDARVEAQSDLEILRRWIDQAVTAATTEEALALE